MEKVYPGINLTCEEFTTLAAITGINVGNYLNLVDGKEKEEVVLRLWSVCQTIHHKLMTSPEAISLIGKGRAPTKVVDAGLPDLDKLQEEITREAINTANVEDFENSETSKGKTIAEVLGETNGTPLLDESKDMVVYDPRKVQPDGSISVPMSQAEYAQWCNQRDEELKQAASQST